MTVWATFCVCVQEAKVNEALMEENVSAREEKQVQAGPAGQEENAVNPCQCQRQCVWSLGGDEASRVHPAAAVESDAGSEPSGAGAADAERAAPGQSGSGFPPSWTFEVHFTTQINGSISPTIQS